jgi:HB1, ASXL, restriction endonuclease HTH domain
VPRPLSAASIQASSYGPSNTSPERRVPSQRDARPRHHTVKMQPTYIDAAMEVLRSAHAPLTTNEMIALAIEYGLLHPTGRTPGNSMAARLYVYVRAHPTGPIRKLGEPGKGRSRRGSVRWFLAKDDANQPRWLASD